MTTVIVVAALALVAFAYVALPLLAPGQADPLPDDRDPIAQDLDEEREALFRAIRELDARTDLPEERRRQLRERYESKAAHVLRAIDERAAELAGRAPKPERSSRFPYGAAALLALLVIAGAALPSALLPRVGPGSNVTTTDVQAARHLQELERTAAKDPSAANLLALGDAYWNLQDSQQAIATYQKVVDTITPVPAAAYKRLAAVYLRTDLAKAYGYLQQALAASPGDPQTLLAMGQVAFAQGDLPAARKAFVAFLATPGNANDAQARQQIALIDQVAPLAAKVDADPSKANLMALADAYWTAGDHNRAVDVYLRVLTGPAPNDPVALARTGQAVFLDGRSTDAIALLRRAAQALGGLDKLDQDSLLMLGNAYFSQQKYQDAIDTWNLYVRNAGGADKAGRVPDLIKSAKARQQAQAGTTTASLPAQAPNGEQLFLANCAVCHGANGQGGSGPALAGNRRAASASNVQDAIAFGRGMMPGFQARLSKDEIAALVQYVTGTLATEGN